MEKLLKRIDLVEESKKKNRIDALSQEILDQEGSKEIKYRDYQITGIHWLLQCHSAGSGSILADEMGLGKTSQLIAFLSCLKHRKRAGRFLVLCPLSVLKNWESEIERFSSLRCVVYCGEKELRGDLQKRFFSEKMDVLLTTYEMIIKDEEFFARPKWDVLVVDEGHRLKNAESILYQILRGMSIRHHVIATGTPIQNNYNELYALLAFVAPTVFRPNHGDHFSKHLNRLDDDTRKSQLRAILDPFMLRRTKEDVHLDLPQKSEVLLYHGLSALQRRVYRSILTKDLDVFASAASKTRLMNIVVDLRKCAAHPYLFAGIEPEPFAIGEHIVEASSKLVVLDRLLSHLHANGHKVLLFSQMTRMLDIVQDYLAFRGYPYERLDGSVRGEERFLAVDNFNKNDDTFVFLLSTRAGGQGLNLVAADTVIFLDSDFNPQNDLQAAARAHRIGQKRNVKLIRLVGRHTIEEIIYNRAQKKLALAQSVTADDNKLDDLLKFGVEKLLDDESPEEEEHDLEAILGLSRDGEWVDREEKAEPAAMEGVEEAAVENIYEFEGKDYSTDPSKADSDAFDKLVAQQQQLLEKEQEEGNRATRTRKATGIFHILPEPERKPRRKLTDEEKAERRRQRELAEQRRAQEEAEEAVEKAQARREKRKAGFPSSYESRSLPLPSDSDEEGAAVDEEERVELVYRNGDVTRPQNCGSKDAVVVHCVDDSGQWARGGVFSALDARSPVPQSYYADAGRAGDLSLGDAHLVPIDDVTSRDDGHDFVALLVCQHRSREGFISPINMNALAMALKRVAHLAHKRKATVHFPRIGHNTPKFNWYGAERLIAKYFAGRGVTASIYYFARKAQARKRKVSSDDGGEEEEEVSEKRQPSRKKPAQSKEAAKKEESCDSDATLPELFHGLIVYFFHIDQQLMHFLKRYVVAFDGDVTTSLDDRVTHVVAPRSLDQAQKAQLEADTKKLTAQVVDPSWIEDSVKAGSMVDEDAYSVL